MSFDPWHFSTLAGLTLLSVFFWHKVAAPLQLKIPLFYFLIYSVVVGAMQPIGMTNAYELGVKTSSLKIALVLILLVLFFRNLAIHYLQVLVYGFFTVLGLDALWIIFGGSGIFYGDTQDTLLFAVFLPMCVTVRRELLLLAPLFIGAILKVKGLGSVVILAAHLALLGILVKKYWLYVPVGVFSWWVYIDQDLRAKRWGTVWGEYVKWWATNSNPWFGMGPGSFEWVAMLGPFSENNRRMWMHSDWLQFIFEFGFVGHFLAVVVYFYILYKLIAYKLTPTILTWVGLGLAMLVYSPLQFFIIQIFVGYIIWYVVTRERLSHGV